MEPHHLWIFLIGFRQPLQPFRQVSKYIRLHNQLCDLLCFVRVNVPEIISLIPAKDDLRHSLRHIPMQKGKRLCVFLHSIFPCSVQHHLRGVFPLP